MQQNNTKQCFLDTALTTDRREASTM